jgi:N utilization substance protein B
MPLIDRTILRMGVAELLGEKPRPRATLNGMIELAKQVGGEGTPAFVNGILDQIRRNLNIPFAP